MIKTPRKGRFPFARSHRDLGGVHLIAKRWTETTVPLSSANLKMMRSRSSENDGVPYPPLILEIKVITDSPYPTPLHTYRTSGSHSSLLEPSVHSTATNPRCS